LFFTVRHPRIKKIDFHTKYDLPSNPPEEVAEFKAMTDAKVPLVLLLSLSYTIFFLKSLLVPIITLSFFNHRNPEESLELLDNGLYKFACILTNCTRLSQSENLAEDLSRLPMLGICKPRMNKYYPPAINLGGFGLLIFSVGGSAMFMMGGLLPLREILRPTENDALMFIAAPVITIKSFRERVERILTDLSVSYVNYRASIAGQRIEDQGKKSVESSKFFSLRQPLFNDPKFSSTIRDIHFGFRTASEHDKYVSDCLPLIRSHWWHSHISRVFCITFAFILLGEAMIGTFIVGFENDQLSAKGEQLESYWKVMLETNCAMWVLGTSDTRLDLKRIEFRWTIHAICELAFFYAMPLISVGALLACYYVISCELNFWSAELHTKIHLAVEYVRIQSLVLSNTNGNEHKNRTTKDDETRTRFCMEQLKQELVDRTDFCVILLQCRPIRRDDRLINSKLDSKIAYQELVVDLLSDDGTRLYNSHHELLEKIYVNLRLFIELVHRDAPFIATLIIVSYSLCFGTVIVAIWYNHHLRGFVTYPMVLLVFAMVVSTVLITLASNFHANVSNRAMSNK